MARALTLEPGAREPVYPQNALDWDGVIPVRYVVDETGRALLQSFEVPGADTIVWKSNRQRRAFEAFTRSVRRAVANMRFSPGENLGCAVRAWATQEFIFVRDP